MAVISGKNGKVNDGTSDVAEITGWTLRTESNKLAYASSSSGGYRKRVAGVRDGSGRIEGKLDATSANAITEVLDVGDALTLKLYVDATHFYSVPAVIDSLDVEVDINTGEPVGWRGEFSANGAWTNPTYS
ncbi:MAG: hypothetical protein KDA63_02860 [Planctomycetales bacterium]|nr:hypothetical protein [Planctomycetales bacterium]